MLGQVRDRDGAVIVLHRSHFVIDEGLVAKAPLEKATKMLGRVTGGAQCVSPSSATAIGWHFPKASGPVSR